jgi:beta-mannosidase
MALNWCFNEPWPTVANNSLVSWPAEAKPAYYAVQKALRPQIASLRVDHHLWWEKDTFRAQVWMLNDAVRELPAGSVTVSYAFGESGYVTWGTLEYQELAGQSNRLCGEVAFPIPEGFEGQIHVLLKVKDEQEMDSEYTYLCRSKNQGSKKKMLNF